MLKPEDIFESKKDSDGNNQNIANILFLDNLKAGYGVSMSSELLNCEAKLMLEYLHLKKNKEYYKLCYDAILEGLSNIAVGRQTAILNAKDDIIEMFDTLQVRFVSGINRFGCEKPENRNVIDLDILYCLKKYRNRYEVASVLGISYSEYCMILSENIPLTVRIQEEFKEIVF